MRDGGLPAIGITITAGHTVNNHDEGYNVPKEQIVTSLQTVFQSHRIVFSEGINPIHIAQFKAELENFSAKMNQRTKNITYEAAKEAVHDDLVMSLGMGVWFMNRVFGTTMDYSENDGKIDYDVLNYGIGR